MNNNNQVVIERDMFCPYCESNSAVLISETVGRKSVKGCAPIGIKNGCLLYITGGCWAIVSGFPLFDTKEEIKTNLFGFCPCCGNTYTVNKPEEDTMVDKFNNTTQRVTTTFNQAKDLISKKSDND